MSEKERLEITLENIVAHLPGHVYWKDENGVYLGANDRQAINLGLKSRDEIVGKTDFDLTENQVIAQAFRDNDLQAMQCGEAITAEEVIKTKDGYTTMLSQKVPLHDRNGKIIGVLGISLDITELKNMVQERLKKADEAKSKFLAIMAQDIATPVSSVLSSLEIFKHSKMDKNLQISKKQALRYVDIAQKEAESIMPKLKDVINYINFDETKIAISQSPCDVEEIITKIVEKYRNKKSNQLSVSIVKTNQLPNKVLINSEHVYNVLDILLGNAFKYTETGSITIHIKDRHPLDAVANSIEITIADTGPGIHKKELDAITQSFQAGKEYQTIAAYDKPSVRIPYAFLLVERILKGRFHLESTVNEGTKFTISLPYCDVCMDDFHEVHQERLSVLLVEDNNVSRQLESVILSKLDLEVDAVKTGAEAVARAAEKAYNIIFLDITLPDMNGVEAAQQFKNTLCSATPIIALTSHHSDEDIEYFTRHGILTVIPKPVSFDNIKKFLNSYSDRI